MDPVYLVDGSGYIFRAFYAVAPLTNRSGMPTNALFGFTRMLAKLLRDVQARYLAVTFDAGRQNFRHELYADYKANRIECPDDLKVQMPYFRKIVEAFGLRSLELAGVEADDIIATVAKSLAEKGHEVVIVSGDKDLLQLVSDRIKVVDAMRDITYSRDQVKTKMGVFPEQVRDYLALIGDSSDNVPGIKGIGPKTAERLIEHFGNLETMLQRTAEIETLSGLRGAKGIREKIEGGREMLELSRELVSLKFDVAPFTDIEKPEDLEYVSVRNDILEPLFDELDFAKLLSSIPSGAARPVQQSIDSPYASKRFTRVTEDNFNDFVNELAAQSVFAFDVETTSLDPLTADLVGISFSWKRGEGYYLPLRTAEMEGLDPEQVAAALAVIFQNPEVKKVGLNLKFDVTMLELNGYAVKGLQFDAMLGAHILHPDRRQNGLKALAQHYLNERMVTYDEMLGEKEHLKDVPPSVLADYACHDAEASFALAEILGGLIGEGEGEKPSLRRAFEEVEMPLVRVLSRMERNGIKVDLGFLEQLGEQFVQELVQLEKKVYELAGREFNLNSPKQLSGVLFDELGLPTTGVKKTQSAYSTDASVLGMLAPEHEIAARLLDYRELHKLNSTYVEALKRLIHPKTGRIHTSFNQAIAATGRLSSTEPNLQNIPIRNPRGRLLRKAFIAEPGNQLLSVDYSQIELRVLAHLSGDENLRRAFMDDEDIHLRTAKELFGGVLMGEEEQKNLRRIAKTINFGIIYGMSAFRLAGDLEVSRKQAQKYIDDYFARYPRVKEYFQSLRDSIERVGYVETLHGRRRFAHEVDTTGRDAGYAERSLLNAAIQGTAAEIIKLAMIKLDEQLEGYSGRARMVLQVHDELVFEIDESILDEVRQRVIKTMETAVSLAIPLKVDARSGASWG